MLKIGDYVRLIATKHRPDMLHARGHIIGILYSDPIQYHIVYEGFEGSYRSTADQLELVDERV